MTSKKRGGAIRIQIRLGPRVGKNSAIMKQIAQYLLKIATLSLFNIFSKSKTNALSPLCNSSDIVTDAAFVSAEDYQLVIRRQPAGCHHRDYLALKWASNSAILCPCLLDVGP